MKQVSRPAGTPRPALSATEILDVSVDLADREGLTAVSMRRVARTLSVTPMALYWHFRDKDRLLDAMAERVVGATEFVDDPDGSWAQRLRTVLATLTGLLRAHPWLGRLVIERVVPLPKYLTALEILLDSTRQAGLSPDDGAALVQQAVQAVVALAEYEPKPRTEPTPACAAQHEFLRTLPIEEFPNVRAAATPLTAPQSVDDYYRLGIDMIVGGIGAVAAA